MPPDHPLRRRLRTLVSLSAAAAAWSFGLYVTGGFAVRIGSTRLSSRNWHTPALLAIVVVALAWVLATRAERQYLLQTLRSLARAIEGGFARLPARIAALIVAVLALSVLVVGITRGARTVGGADAYGYVSQAHLWAKGTVRQEQPFVRDMTWEGAAEAFGPLGYRPLSNGTTLVPMFPPGLPLTMAAFEIAGGRDAVFLVVPVLGALAVWATYVMGTRLAGRGAGLIAAALLATSPTFVVQLMMPMTDVPVTAWWAVCLASIAGRGRSSAFAAGLAAGMAILTRMNLAPLLIVAGALVLVEVHRERSLSGLAAQRALLFGAGLLPVGIAAGWINAALYGSPFVSGLGSPAGQFSLAYAAANLSTYPAWLLEIETPIVLLGLVTPGLMWRWRAAGPRARSTSIGWLVFVLGVLACYLFYLPHNAWVWLRYLLPAFPALLALTGAAFTIMFSWASRGTRVAATALLIAAVTGPHVRFVRDQNMFLIRDGEERTRTIATYITQHLPDQAVFLSLYHSGSIRYYSGRLTVRLDLIPPGELDHALVVLRGQGYHPYLALEPEEEDFFRTRFSGHSRVGALDWPPSAELDRFGRVRIFDLVDPDSATARARVTEMVRW